MIVIEPDTGRVKPTIICFTPVRNNAWILNRCIQSASLWADHIIILDQMSTDGSREIAKKYDKVISVDNPSEVYNEYERHKLLIDKAREIEGPRLLIALDADEIFSPNVLTCPEWETVKAAKPGTIIKFQWANFHPNLKQMWFGHYFPWGYMDDGIAYGRHDIPSEAIHCGRIPLPPTHDVLVVNQIKVIHYQYINWYKMQSKHCWYQCYESLTFPEKSKVDLYRQYHHMDEPKELVPIPEEWFDQYNKLGIDISTTYTETMEWFDGEVLKLIEKHGANHFAKLSIWDIDWTAKAVLWAKPNSHLYNDPRGKLDRYIHNWLKKTQGMLHKKKNRRIDRVIKLVLKY